MSRSSTALGAISRIVELRGAVSSTALNSHSGSGIRIAASRSPEGATEVVHPRDRLVGKPLATRVEVPALVAVIHVVADVI
jgi:hypothetical protein